MTLDDAIVAFGQVATDDFDSIELDLRDYERLVKWLTELKLARESAFSDIGLAARAVSENHQLKAENAKLRELVLHTVECVRRMNDTSENGGCVLCPYQSIDYDCEFENRARELGLEVDDD